MLRSGEQRKAVASPLRIELLGQFIDRKPLSVAEIAERMGRSATGIHYHVRVLEKAGILRRVGQQRSGRRPEALYKPVADVFKMEQKRDAAPDDAVKTLSAAFRMAERDMRAAMSDPGTKSSGPYRNIFGGASTAACPRRTSPSSIVSCGRSRRCSQPSTRATSRPRTTRSYPSPWP